MRNIKIKTNKAFYSDPDAEESEWIKQPLEIENNTGQKIYSGSMTLEVKKPENITVENNVHQKTPPFKIPLMGFLPGEEDEQNKEKITLVFRGDINREFTAKLKLKRQNKKETKTLSYSPEEE